MPKQSTKIYKKVGTKGAFGNPELIAAIKEEQIRVCTSCGGDGICSRCEGTGEIRQKIK